MLGAIRWDGAVTRGAASGAVVVVVGGGLDESIKGRFKMEEARARQGCMPIAEICFL
jgi:hypothetical protein